MTQEERSNVAEIIRRLAQYYSKKIDREVVTMMVDDFEDLLADDVIKAYSIYRRDPKNKFFPLPAQIKDLISPEVTQEAQGREIVAKITEAISRFGYPHPAQARAFIGDIGWQIIKQNGGWEYVCANLGVTLNLGQFSAQVRERAIDLVKHNGATNLISIGYDEKLRIERKGDLGGFNYISQRERES